MIGFGRLMMGDDEELDALAERSFGFSEQSRYKALQVDSQQYVTIKKFESHNKVRVHYLLYHPLILPWVQIIPVRAMDDPNGLETAISAQVLRSADLRKKLSRRRASYCPTFADLSSLTRWPLENFVADQVLGCQEGYIASGPNDSALRSVFSRRAGPIAASLAITIDHV
jgi:hypothetical protein